MKKIKLYTLNQVEEKYFNTKERQEIRRKANAKIAAIKKKQK